MTERGSFDGRADRTAGDAYGGIPIFASPGLHERVGAIARERLATGARVLDLGAGAGALSLRLADLGFDVTALDMVSGNFRPTDRARFAVADLDDPFLAGEEDSYDACFAVELIEHLENPRRFLRRAASLVRPGGLLIVTTPNAGSPVSKARFVVTGCFQWFSETDYASLGHITPFTAFLLRNALAEAHLELVELAGHGDATLSIRGWRSVRLLTALLQRAARGSGDPAEDVLVATARRRHGGAVDPPPA